MRHINVFSAIALITILVASCKPVVPPPVPEPVDDRPTWTVSEDADVSHSMTLIMALPDSMAASINADKDLVGVFSGDYCLAVAPFTVINTNLGPNYRAMLRIVGPAVSMESLLTLRYYSEEQRHIYTAVSRIPYRTDDHIGSTDEPYIVGWK